MTKLIIHRQQREAQYYSENLGEGINLDMMLIPSGSFQMGTPDQEIERLCKEYDRDYFQRESPQHTVKNRHRSRTRAFLLQRAISRAG